MFVSCFFKPPRVGILVGSVCTVRVVCCTCVCVLTVKNCWESVVCEFLQLLWYNGVNMGYGVLLWGWGGEGGVC